MLYRHEKNESRQVIEDVKERRRSTEMDQKEGGNEHRCQRRRWEDIRKWKEHEKEETIR